MEKIAKEVYPEVDLLKQVKGVGTQIALTYVLTIEDPYRFPKSRQVGCFLGLRPGRRNSGKSEPQKGISKEGDRYLRTMMVQGAHYVLGPFGETVICPPRAIIFLLKVDRWRERLNIPIFLTCHTCASEPRWLDVSAG